MATVKRTNSKKNLEKAKYRLEEYKQLREHITFLEKNIGQYFLATVVASISLLSALGAILFKIDEKQLQSLTPVAAYFFLAPPLIVIPVLHLLADHRKNMHRISTYIQIFMEEPGFGGGWESRLDNIRKTPQDESLKD